MKLCVILGMAMVTVVLHLNKSNASLKKLFSKKCDTYWEEELEPYCTTTYEKKCEQAHRQECSTEHTEQCTVEYVEECENGTIQQCVTETRDQCETDYTTECWEEPQKDCRTTPKCHTVYQRMCSTIYKEVCPFPDTKEEEKVPTKTSKWKRETKDVDPAFVVAVENLQKMSTRDLLDLCQELSKEGEHVGVALRHKRDTDLAALKYAKEFLEDEKNAGEVSDISNENNKEPSNKKRSVLKSLKKLLKKNKNINKSKQSGDEFTKLIATIKSHKFESAIVPGEKHLRKEKRSAGHFALNLINQMIAGKGDCKEVPSEHCVNVPVEKCHDVQNCEYSSTSQCQQVPHERCWEEPHQRCWEEPHQKCSQEPKERCWQEPHEKCWQEPHEVCHDIPHEKCDEVKVQVAKKNCKQSRKKRDYVDEEMFEDKINFLLNLLVQKGIASK